MKRIFTLMALAAFALTTFAQSPDLMTYQAVLRDAENHLLTNQAIAIQISILQTTPNGTSVYTEVHTLITNANGLASLEIGDGVSGDDFSLIDWSAGPFYLKSETDPAGGANYTITSTTQLLSVPYAKYADEAGNAFSGNYTDLTGAPTVVSAFTNDEGYLTGITGSETAFDGWDKDETELWSQNGNDLYHLGGNIGIGTNTPEYSLSVNGGASDTWTNYQNNATGVSNADGLLFGIRSDFYAYLWNYEAGPIIFGTSGAQRMTIEADGDVGIGVGLPTAKLHVEGDTKFGSDGVAFTELREITGTTAASSHYTSFTLPSGYSSTNTRVLSVEINYSGVGWVGQGFSFESTFSIHPVSYQTSGTTFYLYYPDIAAMHSRAYRILIMQIAP